MTSHQQTGRTGAIVRLLMYAAIVVSPLILVALFRPLTDHSFIYTVGKNLALVGFTILAMQFVLSARLKWIERPFGLNVLFQFHKAMAILASLLLISHPVLLAIGGHDWSLIFGPEVMWHLWLGRIALLIVLVHVLLAGLRSIITLNYETWRFIHNLGAVMVLPLGFYHSWKAGGDLQLLWLKVLWAVLLFVAAASYLWHRVVRTILLRRNPYKVMEVREEAYGVWTIKLAVSEGIRRFDYLPGQFHFITFHRAPNLPVEEHHWTISSSPTEAGVLSSTIKESGDFTASIGKTKPGDTALVDGPFGRFSYALHPDERELVFIAGGIGITPLMSMLRHIRDTRAERTVTLLYASTSERDIVFRDELAEMERAGVVKLKVVHVLSKPSDEWKGERGRLDEERIKRCVGPELARRAFYVCAPPELMQSTIQILRKVHVPAARIHFERFNL
ncbi:MAG: ferredoxin reductase family protein [Limisphaerales bacterium]